MNNYQTIVGMEIHVELKTKSKMFCGCTNDPFHAPKPNIYTCPVCLGMPGGLPVPNKKAIEWTIRLGLALGCQIAELSKFDRKNYFYPDLAKGYQISQYDQPIARSGKVSVGDRVIRIHRVHLEEDTGKLHHATVGGKKVTLVDFNRSGVPLVEIVTEPDIHSGEEAKHFLKKLHQIIRYLDISDADMEKGTMRLEPNISVRAQSSELGVKNLELPNYKVEVKNINSFNFVKKAIEFETKRHIELLEKGQTPVQETRGWNEDKGETVSQRIKETADDYRYFPEPDIPPLRFTQASIAELKKTLPELPEKKIERFTHEYGLTLFDAVLMTETQERARYFEACLTATVDHGEKKDIVSAKTIANWILNKKIDVSVVTPGHLITQIVKATAVVSVDDTQLQNAIAAVLAANPKAVSDYKAGKEQVVMFLFGNVLKVLGGKGDKAVVLTKLKEKLSSA